MSLPTLSHPKFNDTIPSTKQPISYRPFLVKEQKILLMAAESKDSKEIEQATKEVLKACISNIDVETLSTFDIEYLFLRLRSKSVGEKLQLTFHHNGGKNKAGNDCDVKTDVNINLDEVKVYFNPLHNKTINLSDDIVIEMKYPSFEILSKLISSNSDKLQEDSIRIIAECIKTVFKGEEPFSSTDYSVEDRIKFIENLTESQFSQLLNFFTTMPKLLHVVKYKCNGCGQEDEFTLAGLSDFF
jgi:hypothetical protein